MSTETRTEGLLQRVRDLELKRMDENNKTAAEAELKAQKVFENEVRAQIFAFDTVREVLLPEFEEIAKFGYSEDHYLSKYPIPPFAAAFPPVINVFNYGNFESDKTVTNGQIAIIWADMKLRDVSNAAGHGPMLISHYRANERKLAGHLRKQERERIERIQSNIGAKKVILEGIGSIQANTGYELDSLDNISPVFTLDAPVNAEAKKYQIDEIFSEDFIEAFSLKLSGDYMTHMLETDFYTFYHHLNDPRILPDKPLPSSQSFIDGLSLKP